MEPKKAKLTIVKEVETKELKNAKGEPYNLVSVVAKSAKAEFEAVLFLPIGKKVEIGKEAEFMINEGKYGNYVIKELTSPKAGFQSRGVDRDLEIWRIALQTAVAMGGARTVPDVMGTAQLLVTQLKAKLK